MDPMYTASTSNSSESEPTDVYYEEDEIKAHYIEFIVCNVMLIPFAILLLYLTISQTVFLYQKSRKHGPTSFAFEAENKRQVKTIDVLCIVSSVLAFIRVGIDWRLVFGRDTDLSCNIGIKTENVSSGLALSTIYFTLWMRQRIFYKDVRLQHLSSKIVRFISWFMVVFLALSFFCVIVLFVVGVDYKATPLGCLSVARDRIGTIRWVMLLICSVTFQICILALFVYPLIKHRQAMKKVRGEYNDNDDMVIKLVKRTTISTATSLCSDMVVFVIVLIIDHVGSVGFLLYDLTLITNLICLILSFPDWKRRIQPWKTRSEIEEGVANSETRISQV